MTHLIIHDQQKKKIEFKDSRFYQCHDSVDSIYVPSVTTILDCAPKGKAFYEWLKNNGKDADTISLEAMEKGSRIHKATEDYDKLGEIIITPNNHSIQEIEMIHRYVEFSNRYITESPTAIEWGAGSYKLGFGGAIDRVIKYQGKYYMLDIKTGGIYDYYWRQLAAYKELYEYFHPDIKIENYGIIHLKADTRTEKEWQGRGWKVLWNEENHSKWWNLFLNTKQEYSLQHPNASPNNRIFDLHIVKPKPIINYASKIELPVYQIEEKKIVAKDKIKKMNDLKNKIKSSI